MVSSSNYVYVSIGTLIVPCSISVQSSKDFFITKTFFFQNNFGNKLPFRVYYCLYRRFKQDSKEVLTTSMVLVNVKQDQFDSRWPVKKA